MPKVERPVASTTCAPAAYARRTAATTSALMVSSTRPVDGSLANSVPSMSSATSRGANPLRSRKDGLQDLAAAQVRLQRRRDAHRAVGLLVGLEDRHDGARDRDEGAVQRGQRPHLVPEAAAD